MACNCIKEFAYTITTPDCKHLLYQDNSTWVEIPETYEISIEISGYPIKIFTVTTNSPTLISAVQLIGIDQNLPTGIYCIKVTNCNGDIIQYDYLNLCTAECSLSNLLSNLDLLCTNEELETQTKEYLNIKFWLDAIRAKFNCDWCARGELKLLITALQKKLSNAKNCKCS